MESESLPSGWEVWSRDPTTVVLAFRPDVFDGSAYPAACLPTIYLTKGRRGRRPGRDRPAPDDPWYVTLFLEPDVTAAETTHDTREAAIEGARGVARDFADGEVDYRGSYQVPREAYLDRLDELTGSAGRGT